MDNNDSKKIKKVHGNDSFQRMNYLYQPHLVRLGADPNMIGKRLGRRRVPFFYLFARLGRWTVTKISKNIAGKYPTLSSYYGNLIINVAKKHVLKISPDIKRQICKRCRCMLIHKVTATMKIKIKNKSKIIQWTCHTCGANRNFPANKDKDHRIWIEKPEAVIEVIE